VLDAALQFYQAFPGHADSLQLEHPDKLRLTYALPQPDFSYVGTNIAIDLLYLLLHHNPQLSEPKLVLFGFILST
jgi:hypothetical protein